jgi:uncharacterized membrane protein YsdA (DUF1294 family)
MERSTRSDGSVRTPRIKGGGSRKEPTVASGGKIQPVTVPNRDGRREPTGRIPARGAGGPAKHAGTWGVGATVGLFFVIALLLGAVAGRVPAWVALVYAVMSVITVLSYRLDKSAAVGNRRRTPERSLHLLALLGGWPGALLAQSVFRHKSSKTEFQWAFRATVAINLGVLAWLLWSRAGIPLDRLLINGWQAVRLH